MTSPPDLLVQGPAGARATLVLGHGAGAGMDAPFLEAMASGLVARGVRVARFEFPYMARRRREGGRRPPDREPVLRRAWHEVLRAVRGSLGGDEALFFGGKSMGGRIASLIADEEEVRGLVCLGYPFHPVGKPERPRTAHLADLRTPTLIVQGTRDPFGNREDVAGYELSPAIEIVWVEDGDHSFKPRARSGRAEEGNLAAAVAAVADFLERSCRQRA